MASTYLTGAIQTTIVMLNWGTGDQKSLVGEWSFKTK